MNWLRIRRKARTLGSNRRGSSAIEFALLSPIMIFLFTGMVDFGMALWLRFDIEQQLSASTNLAIVRAANVSSANGATLASQIAAIASSDTDIAVVINNGPSVSRTAGTSTPTGTAANADQCYCPTFVNGAVSWGSAQTCGNSCPSGIRAGKFVSVVTSREYDPIFSDYGFVDDGRIYTRALVQVQ